MKIVFEVYEMEHMGYECEDVLGCILSTESVQAALDRTLGAGIMIDEWEWNERKRKLVIYPITSSLIR